MECLLERKYLGDTFTEGELFINGEHECFIIEDKDRKIEEVGCSGKVAGKTCIPRGRYELIIRWSPRFKKHLVAVTGVKCFDGILFHSGNDADDTDGCLITGRTNNRLDDGWVSESRLAYEQFHRKVKQALSIGDKVTLEIA